MKDMIVLVASIILGIFIFELIAGSGNSIKNSLSRHWQDAAGRRQYVVLVDER